MKRLLILPMMLMATVAYGAGWDETVTTPSGDDTVMINDVSAAPGSTSQFSSFKNFPVPIAVQSLLDGKVGKTGDETISGVKTFTNGIVVSSTGSGPQGMSFLNTAGTNYSGWGSAATNTNDLMLANPTTDPAEGQVMVFSAPVPVQYNDGVTRDTAQGSWADVGELDDSDTNVLEWHFNSDQLGANGQPDEGMTFKIPHGVDYYKISIDCDGTTTSLTFDIATSTTRYGTYTDVGTAIAPPQDETNISSLGSITAGTYIAMRVSADLTGDSTQCDTSLTLKNQ